MKIDNLFFQIFQASRSIEFLPNFRYDFIDYITDIKESQVQNIDWDSVFKILLTKLEDLQILSKELLESKLMEVSQNKKNHETEIDFDVENFSSELPENISSINTETNGGLNKPSSYNWAEGIYTEKFNKRLEWIKMTLSTIEEFQKFFRKEKNNPPFTYPFRKDGKIPFLGSFNDFAYLFALLEVHGLFFLTHRFGGTILRGLTKKHTEIYKNVDFEKLKIKKEDIISFLVRNFYLVKIDDKGKITYEDITYSTLKQKVGLERKKDISHDQMVVFKNYFQKILSQIEPVNKLT